MTSSRAWQSRAGLLLAAAWLDFSPAALAQPSLESLWPNLDGARWDYRITAVSAFDPEGNFTKDDAVLHFAGTVETPGGTAQRLEGHHGLGTPSAAASKAANLPPLLRTVWRARPDLRAAITAHGSEIASDEDTWWPLLLHTGPFFENPTNIEMWQLIWSHPTWTYLTDDLQVGSSFTQQLIPEIADDVFLHGRVESIDATVTTVSGTLSHAVRIEYRVDYGWAEPPPDTGVPAGARYHSETRGSVDYVPGIGPVALLEDFIPYVEVECGHLGCPQEWLDQLGQSWQTLELSLIRSTVALTPRSWSQVKATYR
jgi:hypothetical protein